MNRTVLVAGLIAAGACATPALSGDRWQECAINGGLFEYDGEALYEVDEGARKEVTHKKLQTVTLNEQEGYCETRDGNRFNWANHTYAVRLDIPGTEGPFQLWALCEEGGSGVPATDQIDTTCVKNVYTKNRQLVPQYENKAGQ